MFYRTMAVIGIVMLTVSYGPALAQSPLAVDAALTGLTSSTMTTRADAFYHLLQLGAHSNGTTERKVQDLLRTWPAQGGRIKLSLIATLEIESVYRERTEQADQNLTEQFLNYSIDLIAAVGILHDQRAIKGLLEAASEESAAHEFLADLCPTALDAIIAKFSEPERFWRGKQLNTRAFILGVLQHCLARPGIMQSNPAAFAKVRKTLLAALEDVDPAVRNTAATGLSLLRTDPEVRAKLSKVAITDSYTRPVFGRPDLPSRYPIRGTAAWALRPRDENRFQNVTRTADSRECRVQRLSETPVGDVFIGPVTDAQRQMCTHYDEAGTDPSLCWLVVPRNACLQ
jgi:hypothetical protein